MFSKKPEPATRPLASARAMAGATFSVIGPDVVITGNIEASADLHIDGRVTGDITCAALVAGEESNIEGAVRASSARLAGALKGTVEARDLVVLKSARIEGDILYETLTIEQGAAVSGRFTPQGAAAAQSQAALAVDRQTAGEDGSPLALAG